MRIGVTLAFGLSVRLLRAGVILCLAPLSAGCGSSGEAMVPGSPGVDGGSDAPTRDAPAAAAPDSPVEAAPPPACAGTIPCIQVDATLKGHTISPLVFGDQIQWTSDGQGFWDPTTNTIRAAWITALQPLGLTLLRYPGGTLSDFFDWAGAVGRAASRTPQEDGDAPDAGSFQMPLFGPDEFTATAAMLGTQTLITANVGTGNAQEAAAWLTHYEAASAVPKYWEIGNEVYLVATSWSSTEQQKTPAEYVQIFDAYASALRAVDPSVKVGMLGCHDSGAFNLCADETWNQTVLSGITQNADFIAVHNSYAPAAPYQADLEGAMRATLAAPDYVAANFALVEQDLAQYGQGPNASMPIAVTEHASFFVPSGQSTDLEWITMNETLGAAIFSASEYDVFLSDARIQVVNHINPIAPVWQAMVTTSSTDGVSQPTTSAFGLVFQLYAETAGGTSLAATILHSPTFDSPQVGIVPALNDVAILHGVAALSASGDRLWLYVNNRDLAEDVTAQVVVSGFPAGGAMSITSEVVDGAGWQSVNQPGQAAAVTLTTSMLATSSPLVVTFPAHSLTRLTIR